MLFSKSEIQLQSSPAEVSTSPEPATDRRMSLARRLLQTETERNPKVLLSRFLLRVLPESAIRFLKKRWYAYLVAHRPENWMESDSAFCARFISPGDVVLDVGASIGSFAHFLSKRCSKVYAFEPIPQTFEFLKYTAKKLKMLNVSCHNVALSDRNEDQQMVIPTYRWGQECWYDAELKTEKSKPNLREFTVHSRTLDSLSLPRIDFIKCDVNGHELGVIKGGISTIRRDLPAMLIEVLKNPDETGTPAYETFELLRLVGYDAYVFDGTALHLRIEGERSQNYFFLTPEQYKRAKMIDMSAPQNASLTFEMFSSGG